MQYLRYYLLLINALALLLMHIDKRRAREKKWRIREASLLLTAALGGSVGIVAGILVFHCIAKHPKFNLAVPVILAVQLAAWWLISR